MSHGRRAAILALSLAGAVGLAWLSRVPVATEAADRALLRMAWSARPERLEQCRELTPAELASVPRHMQQRVVCQGMSARYRLEVQHGGRTLLMRDLEPGGLRADRRVYVFDELPLPAGDAVIRVRFTRLGEGTSSAHQQADVLPPTLELRERLRFRPGGVVLVTYDAVARGLIAVQQHETVQ